MLELNHRIYPIYKETGTDVNIKDPKDIQVLINNEPNGTTLNNIFKEIDEIETNRIFGWSVLENYKIQDGYFVDNEGNTICLFDGENKIFFRPVKKPVFISDEIEVSLDYIKDISTLLNLNIIEETLTNLEDADKQILIEERNIYKSKQQQEREEREAKERLDAEEREREEIEALEKAEAEAKAKLESKERKAKEQAEKEAREKLEQEEREKQEVETKAETEARQKLEAERAERAEQERKEQEELESKQEQERKEQEELEAKRKQEEEENKLEPVDWKEMKQDYLDKGYAEYVTTDGLFTLLYGGNVEITLEEDGAPILVAKRKKKFEEVECEMIDDNQKFIEFGFNDGGIDKVIILNKKDDCVEVKIL